MRFFSRLPTFVTGMMIKLGSLPGLGFLQNWVFAARAMKYQFGDHAEDYQVYLMVGQDVLDEAKGAGGKPKEGKVAMENGDDTDIYDDYEFGDSSRVYQQLDDYPTSDDQHRYYDDDYRAS